MTYEEGRWVCSICGKGFHETGSCTDHPGEPLLDTDNREVRFFLMRLDDTARNRAYAIWSGLGLALGLGIWVLLLVFSRSEGLPGAVVAGVAGAVGGAALAKVMFKPRFQRYTDSLERPG